MPQFGKDSLTKLSTCHPDLQKLFNEVIKHYDCTILEGHRSDEDQLMFSH
jgi:peptidoglycan L-alanyl-D-glutamate endopeptidase CwlK